MRSTKKKPVQKKNGKVYVRGRTWTKAQLAAYSEYQVKYQKESYRSFVFRISREKDPDMIAFLESQENLTDYIRKLIDRDMKARNVR